MHSRIPNSVEQSAFSPNSSAKGLKPSRCTTRHTREDIKRFKQLAKRYKLVEVGGTDSGSGGVGDICVSYSAVKKLEKCLKK